MPVQQHKVMRAVELCRTAELGGHVSKCEHCGKIEQYYNSCRNRHCPGCQAVVKEKWLEARQADLLPVEYFHVVFTLPHQLNTLANSNPKIIYDLLFQSAWETIKALGYDPKRLNGEMGMLSILHTWGQNLSQHIHIHCLIPNGALNQDKNKWHQGKRGFLFPIKVMSQLFRGIYVSRLRKAYEKEQLIFEGHAKPLQSQQAFTALLNELMASPWVIYSKQPFAGPEQVLNYIGRYTHKIAITNTRIMSCKDGIVRFKWRDYSDNNKNKIMALEVNEFIRRFLQHALPPSYVRIRHHGFMANRTREKKITAIRTILQANKPDKNKSDTKTIMQKVMGIDIDKCRACGVGKLHQLLVIPRPKDTRVPAYWDTS